MIAVLMATVLVVAIGGLGVWLLWERRPQTTVTTYPMEYQDLIRWHAAYNDLPPAYVAAVVLAESGYRADAVSSVNAQGLMQILPDTGEWLSGKFDEEYVEGSLFNPETNLKYGCWYLGWLMDRYDGSMECASSAYHQGQGTVDKWLANPEYSQDGKTLSVIPSDATKTYVNRILKYYEKYEEIYG
jgi:soluble lytic murein transglycosylase